jgi:hypothetical protein
MVQRGARSRLPALACLVAATALLLSLHGEAHRGHAVWTDITWNGKGFEIVHRVHLADAITINRYVGGRAAIEELASLARVALYVEERFSILDRAAPVALTTIGAEIEDDFMFVYQEWPTSLPEHFPEIDNRLLLDVEPDSQAFIRIEGPGLREERVRGPPVHG